MHDNLTPLVHEKHEPLRADGYDGGENSTDREKKSGSLRGIFIALAIVIVGVIAIGGGVFPFIKRAPTLPLPDPPPPSSVFPAIVEEETIGTFSWKTYRNDEYGFEFRYPKVWSVREAPESWGITTLPRDTANNLLDVTTIMPPPKEGGYGYAMTVAVIRDPWGPLDRLYSEYIPKKNIHDLPFFMLYDEPYVHKGSHGREIEVFIPIGTAGERRIFIPHKHDNTLLLFISGIYNNEFEEQHDAEQSQFDSVLASLDFLDPDVFETDTSDWLTYRNEEYGFEFRYPEGYIVSKIPIKTEWAWKLRLCLTDRDIVEDGGYCDAAADVDIGLEDFYPNDEILFWPLKFADEEFEDVVIGASQSNAKFIEVAEAPGPGYGSHRGFTSHVLLHGNSTFKISFYRDRLDDSLSDEVLSTFRFFES